MDIILNDKKPKYLQIFNSIKEMINSNKLKANEKLPSKRALALDLNVSLNTVINAYLLLLDEGYIYSKEKSGYYVTNQPIITIANKNNIIQIENKNDIIYDFSTENVSNFNSKNYYKIVKEILIEEKYLNKTNILGDITLRRAIKKHLETNRNINISEGQIIIGSGMEMLEDILPLCEIDNITLENPGYHKLELLNNRLSYKLNYQELDDEGVTIPEYRTILYTTPFNQFPTGIKMIISRKKALASYLIKTNSIIIEDDFDAEFRINSNPTTSIINLAPNNVIFFSTFSTTLFPGLRIAYTILPKYLIEKYINRYQGYSNNVPTLNQLSLARFIDEGYYASHLNRKKRDYIKKRNYIIELLNKYNIKYDEKKNYLSIIIELNINNEADFIEKLRLNKIKLIPLSNYDKYHNSSNKYILGYTNIKYEDIDKGIKLIYDIINS